MKQAILNILSNIDRSAKFYATGKVPALVPGLAVQGLAEPLALPVTEHQASNIISLCQQAPYGKGTETLIDTQVRRVWELDGDKLTFSNPQWQTMLDNILRRCALALDLDDQVLVADLYKLLVYEKDSFFLPHQDGEKLDAMVATLVICLPSGHQGGALSLSHANEKALIDFSNPDDLYNIQYVLFYADCEHEIAKLTSGYRVCLTYNVCLAGKRRELVSPDFTKELNQLTQVFTENFQAAAMQQEGFPQEGFPQESEQQASLQPRHLSKLAISLDHQYSDSNFRYQNLKGRDRCRVDVLIKAAKAANCQAYLTLLEQHESYLAESEDEIIELHESELTLTKIQDMQGGTLTRRDLSIDLDEIISQYSFEDESNDDIAIAQEYEGFTGNAGMTLDRWYRYAAVVIWSNENHQDILINADVAQAITTLHSMVSVTDYDAENKANAQGFATKIIQYLDQTRVTNQGSHWARPRYYHQTEQAEDSLLTSLLLLDDETLLRDYVDKVFYAEKSLASGISLYQLATKVGVTPFFKTLNKLAGDVNEFERISKIAHLLSEKTFALTKHNQSLLQSLLTVLDDREQEQKKAHSYSLPWGRDIDYQQRFLILLKICLLNSATEQLTHLYRISRKTETEFSIAPVQLAAFEVLKHEFNQAEINLQVLLKRWLNENKAALITQAGSKPATPPQEKAPQLDCQCKHCATLQRFMADVNRENHTFQIIKKDRLHLEEMISRYQLDIITKLDPRPRPQKLACSKKGADVRAEIAEHNKLIALSESYNRVLEIFSH